MNTGEGIIMQGKKVKIRVLDKSEVYIKESLTKRPMTNGTQLGLSFGITSDLELAPSYGVRDGVAYKITEIYKKSEPYKKEPIYFKMSDILYNVKLNVDFDKDGNELTRRVVVYKPSALCSETELMTERVTYNLSEEVLLKIQDKAVEYYTARL